MPCRGFPAPETSGRRAGRLTRILLAGLVAAALGGCAEGGLKLFGDEAPAEAAAAEETQAPGQADGAQGAQASEGAAPQEAKAPPLPFEAAGELVGRAEADVADILGEPAFKRLDGPAEIWQYRGRDCLLDVFFYPDVQGRVVEHAEFRRRNGAPLSDRDCAGDVLAHTERGG